MFEIAQAGASLPESVAFGPNDRVRIATIGMGIIGFIDTDTALKVPGVELVAAADLYEGRRIHAKEVYGDRIATHVDYREILARKDVDAVLICVPDHWHSQISIDAMKAGKAVYCEKPMVRLVDEGPAVIAAEKETGAVFQVGSQYASSVLYDKVRELIKAGAIGAINSVEARYNRNSPIGAWQYYAADRRLARDGRLGPLPGLGPQAPVRRRSASSAGGTTPTTARPSRATCSSTCSRASTTRSARWARPGSRAWEASGTGRTAATSTT